jgi:molecular chaperone GrpE (heat shock protein)
MLKWLFSRKSSPTALDEMKLQSVQQAQELTDQITKLTRLYYKSSQEINGKLDQHNYALKQLSDVQDLQVKLTKSTNTLEQTLSTMLQWLDELDTILSKLAKEESHEWKLLLGQWSQRLLDNLALLGLEELEVLSTTFDPSISEAIGVQSASDADRLDRIPDPYEVLEVVRRGFVRSDGSLYRKAQVITWKE